MGSAPGASAPAGFAATDSRIGQASRTSAGSISIQRMRSATREPGGMPPGVGSGPVWRRTSVANRPGAITWTRTPEPVTSSARASLKPMTPNFEAQYGASKAIPWRPDFDDTFRMSPRPARSIAGSTARLARKVPRRFVSTTSSHSGQASCATVRKVAPAARRMPAACTRMSMRPCRSRVAAAMRAMSPSARTSSGSTSGAAAPASTTAAAVSVRRLASRPTSTGIAPARASETQVSRPMPLLAPVTIATRPASGPPAVTSPVAPPESRRSA